MRASLVVTATLNAVTLANTAGITVTL